MNYQNPHHPEQFNQFSATFAQIFCQILEIRICKILLPDIYSETEAEMEINAKPAGQPKLKRDWRIIRD